MKSSRRAGTYAAVMSVPPLPFAVIAYAIVKMVSLVSPERSEGKRDAPSVVPVRVTRLSACLAAGLIWMYQHSLLRLLFERRGNHCVYLPTCTDYAQRAVERYGLWQGLLLTGDRYRRCSEGGCGNYIDFP